MSINFVPDGTGYEVDFLVGELNWELGQGTLTNIASWRSQDSIGGNDIDQCIAGWLSEEILKQYQWDMRSSKLIYQKLVQAHKAGKVSFKYVITFNMDEYVGIPEDHPESYHR